MNGGSIWRKWDLHVHTPASFQHNFKFSSEEEREKYNGDIWEKYIDELEKIEEVAVIGITDYFSIEGYKKVLEYRNNGRLKNFDLILPNIEFRSNIITAEGNRLNFHVIFSDAVDVEDIEDFLNRVKLILSEPGSSSFQGIGCSRRGLVKVGRAYKNDDNLPEEEALKIGFRQAFVDFAQVLDELESTHGLSGKYLIMIGEDTHGGLSEIPYDQTGHLRTEFYRKCDIIESSNENTIKFWLGKSEKISMSELIDRFGGCKPCVRGSDAHSFDRLCKPANNLFTWIKADPTFEGLKQIIYEPEERVRVQKDNPEPIKSIYTLASVKISNSKVSGDLEIEEQEIPLNPNLVAIIGGKGSGKTALLDLIANCFEDRCKRSGEDKNSFVQRIEEQKPDLTIEISFTGKDVERFSKQLTDDIFFPHSKITYLPQGKIEEYSGDRKKLHEKIKEIIFSNKEVIESGYKQEFEELFGKIKTLEKEIKDINSEIHSLEEDTKPEIERDLEYKKKIKEGELKDRKAKIQDLLKKIESPSKEKVEKVKEEENDLRLKHSRLETAKSELIRFQYEINKFLETSYQQINKINSELRDLGISVKIPPITLEEQLNAIIKAVELIKSGIHNTVSQIESKRKELDELTGLEKEHADLLKEVDDIKNEIELLNTQLEEIRKKQEEIIRLESKRKEKYKEVIENHLKLNRIYEKIIERFSSGKDEILGDIDFKSSIIFNQTDFEERAEDIFDLRRITSEQIWELSTKLNKLISDNVTELQSKIDEYLNEALNLEQFLKKTRTSLDFYNWVFGNYFSLNTEILFNGIPMDKLSMGQKGTVLLKILLAEGDHPLIIDQPEENLDNKFVYEALVDAFREAKKKRQIIIATHNANLVVNTDAEQVIVAEFENNRISYKEGSIENPDIREDITRLLEGGKEAFIRREMKYGIRS